MPSRVFFVQSPAVLDCQWALHAIHFEQKYGDDVLDRVTRTAILNESIKELEDKNVVLEPKITS